MTLYFIQQLYWMLIWTGDAVVLSTSDPGLGARIPRMLNIDLNEYPLAEPPSTLLSFPFQPVHPSNASKKDFVAQGDQVRLHPSTSASKTFPVNDCSTSPRKRKSIDASIVEQREAMALIYSDKRQKISSNHHDSRPEDFTANAVQLRQKEKQVFENFASEHNDRSKNIGRLKETERKLVLFDVQDWSFVRQNSNMGNRDYRNSANIFNAETFFRAMRSLKRDIELKAFKQELPQHSNGYFWIPKYCVTTFFNRFMNESRGLFRYPDSETLSAGTRNLLILNTILKLIHEIKTDGQPEDFQQKNTTANTSYSKN
ncbi:hypothetical protein PTTG_26367 [Puccinia triticina 1-1 BBBD Race 1]|uniref:Uncharacterized protein n=1 Tax=Puccinia triticina (isolate 1-1 / race 1 (BBBD)) TaxID=630390 RepID=A0A180GV22_PUCT1|nr:hypothetical protein PTTG_26367 [Puccinia triticina 1-1 BBBD Race 1]